jgi:serine/threonine protein kinase
MRRIGKVTITAELGAGAGSRVFRVRREADGGDYALKVVTISSRADVKYLSQMKHEFRVGGMLDHPNLVKVHAFEVERSWFSGAKGGKLLLDYVPGTNMNDVPLLEIGQLLRVFEQVAAGLCHMHMQGVFHADLKPKNLIYDQDTGTATIIDYGLSWIKGEHKDRVQGTSKYMAPETSGSKVINERTDVYNFGATMYRLVTLRCVARPQSIPGLIPDERSWNKMMTPVDRLNSEAPAELCELIHWCLSYRPEHRPRGMAEPHAILSRLADQWDRSR